MFKLPNLGPFDDCSGAWESDHQTQFSLSICPSCFRLISAGFSTILVLLALSIVDRIITIWRNQNDQPSEGGARPIDISYNNKHAPSDTSAWITTVLMFLFRLISTLFTLELFNWNFNTRFLLKQVYLLEQLSLDQVQQYAWPSTVPDVRDSFRFHACWIL